MDQAGCRDHFGGAFLDDKDLLVDLVDAEVKLCDVSADTIADQSKIAAEGDKECNSSRREKHGGDSCGSSDAVAGSFPL